MIFLFLRSYMLQKQILRSFSKTNIVSNFGKYPGKYPKSILSRQLDIKRTSLQIFSTGIFQRFSHNYFPKRLCTVGYIQLSRIFLAVVKLFLEESIFCEVKDDTQVYQKRISSNKFCPNCINSRSNQFILFQSQPGTLGVIFLLRNNEVNVVSFQAPRRVTPDLKEDLAVGTTLLYSSYTDARLYCSFRRKLTVKTENSDFTLDLRQNQYAIWASGNVNNNGTPTSHTTYFGSSPATINIRFEPGLVSLHRVK